VTERDFAGKVVVITGAAGGLGRALARAFVAAGARIAALDRDAAGAEALAAELCGAGGQALAIACDVTDAAACGRAMDEVIRAWNRIDVLVNNAGITHRSAWRRTEPEVIRRVMEVNFFGSVHCTRTALDALIASRGLVIVISSVAGFAPLIARTGYAAAKHALHGFFESLRTELADEEIGRAHV
jgi:NAD(P)-dependent dehydrogenase (short-subunit alcohol dehydrogenase family)